MKILVVDDSKVMRKLVIRTIRQAGFEEAEVLEAEDGDEALVIARSTDLNVVLTDWNMPNMTGIELLTALRAEGNMVKVGFVTSESSGAIRQQADAAGASFLLSKPIDADQLADALNARSRT